MLVTTPPPQMLLQCEQTHLFILASTDGESFRRTNPAFSTLASHQIFNPGTATRPAVVLFNVLSYYSISPAGIICRLQGLPSFIVTVLHGCDKRAGLMHTTISSHKFGIAAFRFIRSQKGNSTRVRISHGSTKVFIG
ncbi:uncharacterized protein BO97DRAFT_163615 [Aspergillus homomorphus CBS 101889]|uniref:Uncharacterized protein n=1 Tax=Aspergillus homomorphus (strain CBS 101889) TaxID=1450537 RepID=A0A395HS45_ASPHC|nr:hypothetical protein BO97DRAFT_163615 [Aspergillus homomorphus CBS 101889]RAL09678.1 hypothetical protein BO97DRAFT_163615 [Aspergillus homomorphus CBS 101889]